MQLDAACIEGNDNKFSMFDHQELDRNVSKWFATTTDNRKLSARLRKVPFQGVGHCRTWLDTIYLSSPLPKASDLPLEFRYLS